MSSIRIAVASCVLAVALGGRHVEGGSAFPLSRRRRRRRIASCLRLRRRRRRSRRPEAQSPRRHALLRDRQKDTTLTPEQRLATILEGIAAEDRALAIDPNYVPCARLQEHPAPPAGEPDARPRRSGSGCWREADELRQTAIVLLRQRRARRPRLDATAAATAAAIRARAWCSCRRPRRRENSSDARECADIPCGSAATSRRRSRSATSGRSIRRSRRGAVSRAS